MTAPRLSLLATALLLGSAAAPVRAQYVPPSGRPGYSPYLNLARPGVPPALNYFGLVRPELEFRRDVVGLQNQIGTLQQSLVSGTGTDPSAPLTTGHAATFMNLSHYYSGSFYPGVTSGFRGGSIAARTAPNTARR